MRRLSLILLIIILAGCARKRLSVYQDTVVFQKLASYQVETPDPELICPDFGVKLYVNWAFIPSELNIDYRIHVHILFRDASEYETCFRPNSLIGSYAYELINEDFEKKRGILSYNIQLFEGDILVEEVKHVLWTKLIRIGSSY